jgi:hypothetical protein
VNARALRFTCAALALLFSLAAAARENVTFLLADDNPGHAFFAAARDYYAARAGETGTLVTNARSLADVREFLQRSPLRGASPWGTVRLVAHGSQWQGLRVPVFAHGELAGVQVLETTLERREFPPLDAHVLDHDSRIVIESCGLGRRTAWLRVVGRLFTGDARTPVEANAGYVWFRRARDASGRTRAVREESPYRAVVLAGAAQLDEALRAKLRREWPTAQSAQLQFIAVPLRIDVPAAVLDDTWGRPAPSREAREALRNYGLRWSQLAWRTEHGRLRGEALIVVAAPDRMSAELEGSELAGAL